MKMGLRAAVVVFAGPVWATMAFGQRMGVSHPEEAAVMTTTPEETSKPLVFETPVKVVVVPASGETVPALQVRPEAMPTSRARALAALPAYEEGRVIKSSDVDGNVVGEMAGPSNQLPVGTLVKVRLGQELSTVKTTAGTLFSGRLLESVLRDGRVLLPVGSLVSGRVTDVHGGRRVSGMASIHLQPMTVTLPDGTKYGLRAQVIDTSEYRATKVDSEGTIFRKDHAKETLAVMTLATGSGAAAGALVGGIPGAFIGAGVGAGVSTALWLKQDRQTGLPANSEVTFALVSPMIVGIQ